MVGKILGGRYELLEKIGTGGMAVVYRAKCLLLNRIVAVKILRDDLDSSDEFLKRFNIEAQSAASLTNQHIVSIYDVGKDGDINYIVMECADGQTLKEYIKNNSPIDWKTSVKITMDIADALSEAHKKHIIHRDIKPHNIIVTNEGNIKVTDFGIARVSSGATISVDGDVLGSVHYLSPEQARGGYVDERSDIYSLGVVMYEMLTGKVPFDGDTPVAVAMKQIEQPPVNPCEIIEGIPENVSAIVLKAMCKETAGRYSNVIEMYEDLSMVLSDPNSVVIESKTNDEYIDEATKKIPPIKIDNVMIDIPAKEAKKQDSKKISKSDKKTIVSALITSLVIVLLLSMFAAKMIFPDFNPFGFIGGNKEVEVPDLISKTIEEAEAFLENTDFTIIVKESVESSDEEAGTIIEQYPKAGRKVKGSQSIEVTVAKGGDVIKLKSYENKEFSVAESELRALGLNVKIERTHNENIPVDYVISQYPAKGTSLSEGDSITLYVSDGIGDGEIVVPNLLGMTKSEAKRRIEQENLVVGSFDYQDSSKAKDTVIKQSVPGGDSVDEKTVINLVLSNGEGGNDEENAPTTGNVKEKTLFITLPTDKDEVTVKITSNGSTVYEGIQYPKKNADFVKTVSGTGNVTFEIYIDGSKVASQNVNFGN